ncbi:MAG: polymerase subunit sigma [Hydrocarboniphaga sp.]|uniref:sigma-70 family RNA polymerase sigma factor n=1 Tax=Hydrocarboniphaga sp. TaxID=2033016 RepID=UPI00260F1486|nr:sigma-70 family RNA polymerase sigma factor [Hydrocarboniphaga sp.]MDB5970798.1 polymerase subunit sigma [Hydrocarboniphaga sp.]
MAEPHLDAAYNLARWLTRDPQDAEDVVQEAYLRAFRFFDGFRGGDGRAWLLTIVRHTAYSWLKQNRPADLHVEYVEDETGLHLHAADDAPLHATDPQTLMLRQADGLRIEIALRRLAPEYREVLVLRELEDLSYKDVAQIAGIPIGTVMSRLSRGRRQLRRVLEQLEKTA